MFSTIVTSKKIENMSISNLKEIVEKGKVVCPNLKVAIRVAEEEFFVFPFVCIQSNFSTFA